MNKSASGKGSLKVDLQRQHQAYQAVLEKEGYKDAYRVIYSDDFGTGTIILLVLDIPGFPVSYMVDGSGATFPHFWNYEDPYLLEPPQARIPNRDSSQKYLYHSSTSFALEENDTLIEKYKKPSDYYEGEEPQEVLFSSEDLQAENLIFNSDMNDLLVRLGYRDTTKEDEGLVLNDYNSVQLSSTVKDLRARMYERQQSFFRIQLKVEWVLTDNYGEKLYDTTVTSESGQFARDVTAFDFYEADEDGDYNERLENVRNASEKRFKLATLDALERSMLHLVKNKKVESLMEKGAAEEDMQQLADMKKLRIPEADLKEGDGMNQQIKGVVTIKNEERGGHGSGCIISETGHIITNYHVVAGMDSVPVLFGGSMKERTATVERRSKVMDLALLTLDTSGLDPLHIRQDESIDVGSDVMAIGTPERLQLGQTVTKGIISGVRDFNDVEYIQTDVGINPGNSGGALIDRESGQMIGIVTAKMFGVGVEGIGFAVRADKALEKLKIEYKE